MLDVFLQILSILGIILLVLLLVLLAAILLVLFYPVTYRLRGGKDALEFKLLGKVRWLFGLLRADYRFPESGQLTVKLLWFKLFDLKIPGEKVPDGEEGQEPGEEKAAKAHKAGEEKKEDGKVGTETESEKTKSTETDRNGSAALKNTRDGGDGLANGEKDSESAPADGEKESESALENADSERVGKISEKFQKIKYTISGIYDKIKKIWENITYYVELLREEDTKQLFVHACTRIGKILKSIRPRRVKANLLFGAGAPDVTGYAYGVYGMFSSALGPNFVLTPDFEQKIFQGDFDISGHVTVWVLLWNILKVLTDQKFNQFIKKMKAGALTLRNGGKNGG